MPPECKACGHPKRADIDAALVAGEPLRSVGERYGISATALFRHKSHIHKGLLKAREAYEATRADTLLDQVKGIQQDTLSILEAAKNAGDLKTSLQAIATARGNLELLAKLQGDLQEQVQVNVLVNPQWIELRGVIVAALEPYPEARLAVARSLEAMQDEPRS